MYKGGRESVELAHAMVMLSRELRTGSRAVDLVVAPPYTALAAVASELDGSGVGLAAQNVHAQREGAFTGEISASFLKDAGCSWVILGHSERRQHFHESDALVAEKVAAALASELTPIVCVGETLAQREAGEALRVVRAQVEAFLDVIALATQPVAIAYEPVWAIGTGKTAGPAEAEEVHAAIRTWLTNRSSELGARTRILYGGSVKSDNAASLLGCPNVDGALVGGASLVPDAFGAIAHAAQK
jgi:triosephosphate isomerase